MRRLSSILACLAIVPALLLSGPAPAQDQAKPAPGGSEKRIALVIGNADYKAGALATPANDAGLVAQTLQAAGFDVVGARDLDEDSLRKAMRDFTDKAAASGPDTVAFVYLAGYGLQLNGENYFAPVDAEIGSAADVPVKALRVSDYKRRLAAIPLKARFVVLDAGRNNPFVKSGDPLAGGLALSDADPGSLVAFNAAPGTVGPEEKGPYGAYAQALVEMIREGGLAPDQLFDRVRLRVSETTQGAEVPWNASKLDPGFVFFQRAADAPKLAEPETVSALESRPLKDLGAKEAYSAALKRDTVKSYQEFADAYPREPVTKRVRALAAARREAVTWRQTYLANTPDAYWSYLSRYPRGPHAYDCRRRLRELSAALEPPPTYAAFAYDVPPPPPEEIVYVERPVVYFADPVYDLPPPPPPPLVYLPPPPAYIVDLAPPPPVYDYYALPVPAFAPLPVYVAAPAYIVAPENNVYYSNIHNTTVINEINQENVLYSQRRREGGFGGNAAAIGAGAVAGAALGAAASRVMLPPAIQQRANAGIPPAGVNFAGQNQRLGQPAIGPNGQPLAPQANRPGLPTLPAGPNGRPQMGQPLPGQQNAQPLPQQAIRPGMANPQANPMANQVGNAQIDPRTGRPLAGQPGTPQQRLQPLQQLQQQQQQAGQPGQPGQPNRAQTPQDRLQAAREAQQQKAQAAQAAQQQRIQALQQRQQLGNPGNPQALQAQQRQQQLQERQQALQQRQQAIQDSAQQRAAAQRQQALQRQQAGQQAIQQRAAAQREAAQAQRQQMMQQQQSQQRQQMQQAQQRQQMMQQQQAQQRQQMMQQQAQQRQQMMQQQQAQQRQQMMSRPPPQPQAQPRGGGGGGPRPCLPGRPC